MKQARGQQVVDKILDTANKLFYQQGYNATGINQIIEEAGIAKGSLYQHFPSKTDLLIGYIELNHAGWLARMEAYVEKIADPKEKLLAVFDYHSERQQYREYGGCPFVKANDEAGMSEPKVLESIQETKLHMKSFVGQLVAASGHRQLLSDEDLTNMIFWMVEGGSVAASIFKNNQDFQKAKAIIQKLI